MKVAVVGLGPSGLRAMMLLEQAGVHVEGFEAQDRVGGRLCTQRLPDGSFYEAGGEWIDSDHHRLIQLVTELQGPPVPDDQYPGWFMIGGERFAEDDFGPDVNREIEQVEEEADQLALDLDETPWMNVLQAHLDDQSLGQFLNRACRSKVARVALEGKYRSDEGEDTSEVSLLGWLCGRVAYLSREGGEMSSMRFPNGAQGFCEAMLGALSSSTRLNSPLRYLRREGDQWALGFDLGERVFDRVVLALPVQALQRLRFDSPLSEAKTDAIAAARMSRTVKVALRFRSRFWQDHGLKGRLMTDGLLQQVWDGGRGGAAILLAYLGGADALSAIADKPERLLDELEQALPGAKAAFVGLEVHDWVSDPYAGGGFFSLPKGYVMAHWEALTRPESGLHFAGDLSPEWPGFIEGALESAERVCGEVLSAAKIP